MSKPNNGIQDQAAIYSKQDRIKLISYCLILAAVGWVFDHYLLSPGLSDFTQTAHCHDYLGINGTTWLWYGLFVGLPLFVCALLAGFGWPNGRQILHDGQYPAKGKKVLRPTKIQYGAKAKLMGWLQLAAPVLCLALAIWGAVQAHTLSAEPIKPSAYALCHAQ